MSFQITDVAYRVSRLMLVLAITIMHSIVFAQNPQVSKWIEGLSIEDKVNLVVGTGMNIPGATNADRSDRVPGAAGSTFAISGSGIPAMVMADGPAGVRIAPEREGSDQTFYCTAFPIATLLASTWDVNLVEQIGAAMGAEAREYGVDILLGPAMNIHRNPLTGRNFEYFSEDPYVSGNIGAAIIKGIQSSGVGTSVKHFVANNSETNRMLLDTRVSERALREIYLRGFEIAVKEGRPWTVMSSYNKVNGTFASQNPELLTTILRDEWGFEGFVVTDWFAGENPVAQMQAGNDLLMPGTPNQKEAILAAVRNGELAESVIDRNVARILNVLLQSPAYAQYQFSNAPGLDGHAMLAKQVAAEGTVLLKNVNNTLPMTGTRGAVGVFGVGSYDFITGGTGSGEVNEAYTVSLVQGLENAGLTVDQELKDSYIAFVEQEKAKLPERTFFLAPVIPVPEMPLDRQTAIEKARSTSYAIITIGRISGETSDRKLDGDFRLSEAEYNMLKAVSDAYRAQGKPVIVILNIGNVIEMTSWQDLADAILLPWQGGQEGGNAAADVLTGQVSPSGKLATTFPVKYEDVPNASTFPGKEVPGGKTRRLGLVSMATESEIEYGDDIFVGYRHYVSHNVPVAYPFGYGLSYTAFDYSDLKLSDPRFNEELTVTIRITNSGNAAGREVVQLYIAAPGSDIEKPVYELKGFAKTALLEPGEQEELSFTLLPRDLASFDPDQSAWVVEPGQYTVMLGASSIDIRQEKKFDADGLIVERVNRVLLPEQN